MHPGYPITVGRYEILKPLAEGGFGQVYLARMGGAAGFNRLVAIKRIKREHTASAEFVRDFIREARIGGFMQHHNVVQVLGFDEIEGNYLLVMEFVDGIGLESIIHLHFLDQKPLPLPVVAELIGQASEGLQYIHTLTEPNGSPLKLVHRDIKPSNLLISRAGMVKITDFGIARAAIEGGKNTAAGLIKGTLNYLSPEQARGEALDFRSDLYSLGSILFEMLVLERLWADDSPWLLLGKLGNNTLEKRLEAVPEPAQVFLPILHKLLTRDPSDRFQSAGEVAEQCRHLQLKLSVPGQTLARVAPVWIDEITVRKGEYDVESSPTRAVSTAPEFLHRQDPFEAIAAQKLDSGRRLAPTAPYGDTVPPEVSVANAHASPGPTAIHTLTATPEQLADVVKRAIEGYEKSKTSTFSGDPLAIPASATPATGVAPASPVTPAPATPAPAMTPPHSPTPPAIAAVPSDVEGSRPSSMPLSPLIWVGLATALLVLGGVVSKSLTPKEVVVVPTAEVSTPVAQVQATSAVAGSDAGTGVVPQPVAGTSAPESAQAGTSGKAPAEVGKRPGTVEKNGGKAASEGLASKQSGRPGPAVSPGQATAPSSPDPVNTATTSESTRQPPAPTPRPPAPVEPLKPEPPKLEPPKPVASVTPGKLTVTSRPSAPLSINGKAYKETPVKAIELPPGSYRLKLARPDLNFLQEAEVVLRSGQHTIVVCADTGCSIQE